MIKQRMRLPQIGGDDLGDRGAKLDQNGVVKGGSDHSVIKNINRPNFRSEMPQLWKIRKLSLISGLSLVAVRASIAKG